MHTRKNAAAPTINTFSNGVKKLLVAFIALALLLPAGNAHAGLLSFGSCGAASAVQGAVSQATDKIANVAVNKAGLAGAGGGEVPVKDSKVRNNTNTLVAKECIGDALAFALKEGLISAITHSIVDWINNGFEGGPSFVTDFEQFLGEIADETSLDFIYGSELGFICSPFQLDIRLALATQQQPFHNRIRCSLGDVTDNASAFLKGDFSQGGWPAWWSIHTRAENNPFGARAIAIAELDARIASRQDARRWEVTVGGGYFSKRRCVQYANTQTTANADKTTNTGAPKCLQWEIVTPGAQINDLMSQVLGSGFRQLELADEINEIINALISQLSYQALSSLDGLRGLSSRSSSSSRNGQSYLEALANETSGTSVDAAQDVLMLNIESAIDLEIAYRDEVELLITALEETDTATYACYAQAAEISSENGDDRELRIEELEKQVERAEETLGALVRAQDQAARATAPEALNRAADAYDAILASGALHSDAETAALQSEREDIATVVAAGAEFCSQNTTQ